MEAIGPILILVSIPLILRWVPPNRFLGFRVPSVFRNETVWYDANALVGKHCLLFGLLMAVLEFVLPRFARIPVLQIVGAVGFAWIMIADWLTASRWARERGDTPELPR